MAADQATTTIKMDEQGRVTIPGPTRKILGIDGKEAYLRLDITKLDEPKTE